MTELEYRSLGRSGLRVSAVGLGGNNFGRAGHGDRDAGRHGRGRRRGARRRRQLHRHGRHLRARVRAQRDAPRRGAARSARRGRDRDEVRAREPAVAAARLGRARLAAVHPPRRRGLAAAPADRLDRPLPAAHARPRDADRRDDRGPRRPRARGQGALPRPLEPQRLADRGGRARRPRARARPGSSPRRTSTTCSRAGPKPRCCRRSVTSGSASSRSSRCTTGCSPASSGATSSRPTRASCASAVTSSTTRRGTLLDRYRAFAEERGITMLEATFGWLLAQPAHGERDRGHDTPRADPAERRGRQRMAADRGGGRRDLGAVLGSLTRPPQPRRASASVARSRPHAGRRMRRARRCRHDHHHPRRGCARPARARPGPRRLRPRAIDRLRRLPRHPVGRRAPARPAAARAGSAGARLRHHRHALPDARRRRRGADRLHRRDVRRGSRHPRARLLSLLVRRAGQAGFGVRDALCRAADGWGSLLDPDDAGLGASARDDRRERGSEAVAGRRSTSSASRADAGRLPARDEASPARRRAELVGVRRPRAQRRRGSSGSTTRPTRSHSSRRCSSASRPTPGAAARLVPAPGRPHPPSATR